MDSTPPATFTIKKYFMSNKVRGNFFLFQIINNQKKKKILLISHTKPTIKYKILKEHFDV